MRGRSGNRPGARVVALAGATAATLVGSLSAAGGAGAAGNGVAAEPAAQVVQTAVQATKAVSSATFVGTALENGQQVRVSAQAGQDAGRASVSQGSGTIAVVVVNGTVYFKANAAYLRQNGAGAQAAQLAGKWLSAPTSNGQFGQLAELALAQPLLQQAFKGANDSGTRFSKAGTGTLNGTPVVKINATNQKKKDDNGTVYVASSGPPYILRVVTAKGSGSGRFDISGFNQPVTVQAPTGAIAVAQ